MSAIKTYKREIIACALCISLGAVFATLLHLALWGNGVKPGVLPDVAKLTDGSLAQPFPPDEKFFMRKTANIQSPISVVELWEVASSKSLCIVAVNINRDQNVQNKLYAAQVVMNCMPPK